MIFAQGTWADGSEKERSEVRTQAKTVLEAYGKRLALIGSRRVKDVTGLEIKPYKIEDDWTLQRCIAVLDHGKVVFAEDWKDAFLAAGNWRNRLGSLSNAAEEKLAASMKKPKDSFDILIRSGAPISIRKSEGK